MDTAPAARRDSATPRPFAWERSYPPGLGWDTPLRTSTLPALLDEAAARHGAAPAIEFRGRRLSYLDLRERADRVAAELLAQGVRPGEAVALLLPNTPWHPLAFFAVLRAGARVVHLSPLDPPRALARKLADSGARRLITTNLPPLLPAALALLAEGAIDRVLVGENGQWGPGPALPIPQAPGVLPLAGADRPAAWPALDQHDVAVLQYTGGTTGQPRAALLSHANLTAAVSAYDLWGEATGREPRPDDRTICVLPLFHIYALTAVMLRSLRNGTELLLRPRFDVAATVADIETGRATALFGVPTMFIALAAFPGIETRDLSSLRAASSGGGALPREVADRFGRLTGREIGGGWGMTETAPAGTSLLAGRDPGPGAIGLPLPGIEMGIVALDDPHRALPPGEVGEIRIRGPNVTRGYWNRPEETRAAFADGFLLTGDIGTMDAEGCFFIVDRKKDMLISGGFNVYPRAVEEAIHEHPDVIEAAVIGVPDPYRGQAAKAFVQLREGAPALDLEALRGFLAERLGRHELPQHLELREALPHTPVGKLDKRQLVEQQKGP